MSRMKTMPGNLLILISMVCVFTATPAYAKDESAMMLSLKRLTMDTSLKIAKAAVAECRKRGFNITAVVVNRDGVVQVVLRDTLAAPLSVSISTQKAYTAANFNVPTSRLIQRSNSAIGRAKGVLMSAGGIPISASGQLVGAVGVSGAPQGAIDEACAKAGVDMVKTDLEMSF